jgi:hypothetical protein
LPREPDGAALTAELATRLDAVVPRPARVRVEGRLLRVEAPAPGAWGGEDVASLAEQREDEDGVDWIAYACERALDGVQEVLIVTWLREVWPVRGEGSRTDGPHPEAHAAVRDGEIRLWYGEEDDPVLSLEPIPLDRVLRSDQR